MVMNPVSLAVVPRVRLRSVVSGLLVAAAVCLSGPSSVAQAPIPLPNTITTVAGGATTAGNGITGATLPAKGAACSAGSPYTATDAFGDGCPGMYTSFSADFRAGLQVDGQGNVYVMDSTNAIVRKIDARSGLVTAVTGTAITGCTTNSDAYGDGCPLAQTKLSTARGVNVDPYGNVFIAGYGMQTINILCNAVSPLCPNTANRKQVGYLYRIAGCVASATAAGTSGTGTTNGTSGDGFAASPYGNLPGDVADWNPTNATNLGITGYGANCTAAATLGAVSSPRGVAADRYGNVYIAETGSGTAGYRYRVVVGPATFTLPGGTVLTNPMAGIIALDPAYASITPTTAYGKVYPLLGGFTSAATGVTPPTAIGAACAGPSGGATLDKIGDGCPFYETTSGASGQQGVGTDAEGNVIFADNSESIVRVLYVGASVAANASTTDAMATAIRQANGAPNMAVTQGYVYPIMGAINSSATNTNVGTAPSLGTTTTLDTGITKVAVDPSGDIYIGDYGGYVVFFDIKTGYARKLIATGTACATKTDSVGDSCPANASSFGGGNSGMGIGLSPEGDLYLADNSNALIRKVTASNLVPVTMGSTLTQTEVLHGASGTTAIAAALANPSPDISIGAVTCPAANADGTIDCTVPATFTPVSPGQRYDTLQVTAAGVSGAAVYPVAGTSNGSALAVDSSAPVVVSAGSVSAPVSLAVDGSGDVFTMSGSSIVELKSGTPTNIAATLPASPYQVAVDNKGNIYATGTGSTTITKLSPVASGGYTQSSIAYAPPVSPAAPYGIAVDRQGNVYVADRTNEAVYEIPAESNFGSLNPLVTVVSGLTSVGQLALDGGGNLFLADSSSVKRLLAGATATTTVATSVNPTYIAADTAGDLYVQDATAKTVTEYPLTGSAASVYSFAGTAAGIAVDGNGVVYETEAALGQVNAIQRQNAAYNFGTNTALTFAGTLTDVGNLAATSVNQTDTGDFQVVAGSTGTGCNPAAAQLAGAACTVSGTFTPQAGSGVVSDVVSLLPAVSTVGKLTLTATKNGSAVTTTTTIGSETPTTPVYVASGTEVSFTVSVAASAGTASGSVAVVVDTNASVPYNLNSSGQVVVPLSGLTAGTHTISATYASQNGFTGSATTTATSFSIAQAVSTLSWSPSATTQQFSAAIGTGVLDATATSGGVSVPGYVIYTATPVAGGAAVAVHSASYLPIGTYSLAATFVPNDAVDFSGATGSVSSYSVTKASTTAAVGATQNLVAADGTGNYTSVQAALNTIPATGGGSVYLKPGTYTGDVTVVQPNVSMYGLGGDPTQVVLTHAGGAFGGAGVYAYAGEFNTSMTNGYQLPAGSTLFNGDEGSATLVVAKGVNTAVSSATLIPNGFYADNLTLANTYDTDNVTTTTTYVSSGTCTANAGAAMTYFALYNAGIECASQALAIWTTSDLAVMNNVYTTSLQDTIYAGSQGAGSNGYVPARQYWFRGKVTGDVDYIFGDAAVAFDYSSIYSALHSTAGGTVTIEAQNKMKQTNGSGDYLSGYVMNSNVFTTQMSGMTQTYFGRPYGPYSTWIMLNSYVDQVNALGYIEFSGDTNLPTSTYAEYNDIPYTDPATGSADLNGIPYLGTGGSTGSGVTGTRETTSTDPGTIEGANNTVKTSLTQAQAQQYFPTNFLGQTVPSTVSSTANWNPTAALAAGVNSFVPTGTATVSTVAAGSSVTVLIRPQTPGLGAITNGNYTVPTGTYTLSDTLNGNTTTLASGSLDASGEAYYTSSSLAAGTHNLKWTYGGDANFAGSTTATAYVLTVTGINTTTTLAATTNPITYGQSATITATVTPASGTVSPTGTVTLTIDGSATQVASLSGGVASFTVTNLHGGSHSFTASYAGAGSFNGSTTATPLSLTVNPAMLTVTGVCANRVFGQRNMCTAATVGAYQYSDSTATVFASTPGSVPTGTRDSVMGSYAAIPANLTLTTYGSANYTVTPVNGSFTVMGGAVQSIIFPALPNFLPGRTYQLTARTTSGLPVTYTVTAGNGIASVSGTTLTVSGTGATVNVQASQSNDPTGDYAPATPVSQSFTPQ